MLPPSLGITAVLGSSYWRIKGVKGRIMRSVVAGQTGYTTDGSHRQGKGSCSTTVHDKVLLKTRCLVAKLEKLNY